MKIIKREQALADLIEIADYIAENDEDAADRFLDAFEETLENLTRNPKIGTPKSFPGDDLQNLRMWFVEGYRKTLIFYLENQERIEIVRVIHSARDYTRIFDEED